MRKIKKDDSVIIIAGKSKGVQGKVLRVVNKVKSGKKEVVKLLVEGANLVKKHVKPNPNTNTTGGIVEREAPIDISNVAVLNPVTKKADKIGIRILEDGRKVRYFKSNGELVDI
jgi:large subunit ribosomal protein L24